MHRFSKETILGCFKVKIMIKGKIEYITFEDINERLQAQNFLTQQLVKPFTDLYKQTIVKTNIKTFNKYFEEIQNRLKELINKVLYDLQVNLKN